MTETIGIIGAGIAGARLVEKLVTSGYEGTITLIGEENALAYNRVNLSAVLAQDIPEDSLPLFTLDWYQQQGVRVIQGETVVRLNARSMELTTKSGQAYNFDQIVLATGSNPFVPQIPGIALAGVMSFRTLQDVHTMRSFGENNPNVVVVGGGLLGLEAAHGLNKLGAKVSVIHNQSLLMNRQLDKEAARLLLESLEARGVNFLLDAQVEAILGGSKVEGVVLVNGESLLADLVVFATGITPNIKLATDAGLRCERGVVVNSSMETSMPNIYAVGECAEFAGSTVGIVAPILEQVNALVAKINGGDSQYQTREYATQLKVSGIDVFSVGRLQTGSNQRSIVIRDPKCGVYRRLNFTNDRLTGAVLFGDKQNANDYDQLISGAGQSNQAADALMFQGIAAKN